MKGFSEALDDRRKAKLHKRERKSFLEFVKAKLHKRDPGVVKLVSEFRSLPKRSKCVFCKTRFQPAHPGKCSVHHQIDDWEADDEDGHGRATYYGTCSLCREEVSAEGDDCQGPSDCEEICYSGPHVKEFPDGYGGDSEHST